MPSTEALTEKAKKRFVGKKNIKTNEGNSSTETIEQAGISSLVKRKPLNSSVKKFNSIPAEILENKELNEDIASYLPKNYNFEIHKSVHQIRKFNAKKVALQFPEGI